MLCAQFISKSRVVLLLKTKAFRRTASIVTAQMYCERSCCEFLGTKIIAASNTFLKSHEALEGQMASTKWKAALFHFCLACLFVAIAPATHPEDTAALMAFLDIIDDPLGRLQNWQGNDPCGDNWEGVFCSVPKDNMATVIELRLLNHNLTGKLAPQLGNLTNLHILDLMWNQITGSIPRELGKLNQLELLLLNGNNLTGSIPNELGYLNKLDRLQIDLNQISGSIPSSFKNMIKLKHLHMNNNSISGAIPPELGNLPLLLHVLLDNNNLTGLIPSELGKASTLTIIQLDNNKFVDATIPQEFGKILNLSKLSLRNCNLQGQIPDLSGLPNLEYLDLSNNQLAGQIPRQLSQTITTIDLSSNQLNGSIPESFGSLPNLQALVLRNNRLAGPIPKSLGTGSSFDSWPGDILVDFQNNSLSLASRNLLNAVNKNLTDGRVVNIWLHGNRDICNTSDSEIRKLCISHPETFSGKNKVADNSFGPSCDPLTCSSGEQPIPSLYYKENLCRCARPIAVGYRLKSPGFSYFSGYVEGYEQWIARGIGVSDDQVYVESFEKEPGPRFATVLKVFPLSDQDRVFNISEVMRIYEIFGGWKLPHNDTFGPQELLFFNYTDVTIEALSKKKTNWGAIAAILVGCIIATAAIVAVIMLYIMRRQRNARTFSNRNALTRINRTSQRLVKVAGVKAFTYEELALATKSFNEEMQVGQGGYGMVYRGVLEDGQVVAIKRAKEGSLQGADEFHTEIELLSRVHHRNLVALIGYCTDKGEQMLVYEFMPHGTLRDHLSSSDSKHPLDFATRFRIALGAARGILYLHNEANPPIYHRDIKASNILLDRKNNAKVADFGLSKLAPNPDREGSAPGHVSTVVKGTPGYLDPEYFLTHMLTDKSDVYSFGVVLLELITGMRPIAKGKNIVREVKYAYDNGMMLHLVDPHMGAYPAEALEPLMRLALACCKDDTEARPSMSDVVRDLEDIWRLVPWSDSVIMSEVEPESDVKENKGSMTANIKNPYISSDGDASELLSQTIANVDPR